MINNIPDVYIIKKDNIQFLNKKKMESTEGIEPPSDG
tara:strand:- start:2281 stop:2391 length:111 start_codon:yes stop_codon:yes gene_type:complete